jgi:hypothetical protein
MLGGHPLSQQCKEVTKNCTAFLGFFPPWVCLRSAPLLLRVIRQTYAVITSTSLLHLVVHCYVAGPGRCISAVSKDCGADSPPNKSAAEPPEGQAHERA